MSRYVGFDKASIDFLEQLAANNEREWFRQNKARYEEQVLDVALTFIQSMQEPLARIAPHFTAIPQRVGGSLMRVYRDTRFSKNKLPYKTNIGIQFRHQQAKDVHSPGYYVHIDPERVFVGVGMWRPDADSLIRSSGDISGSVGSRSVALHADSTRTMNSSMTSGARASSRSGTSMSRTQFQRKVEASFAAATPFMQFLCKAVNVKF
jgi:uncharacterized protein (TIGR02453 family)